MSYSQAVRTALAARDPGEECCQTALLAAIAAIAGRPRPDGLLLELETAAVARQAFRLAKARPGVAPRLERGGHPYRVTLEAAREPLEGPHARREPPEGPHARREPPEGPRSRREPPEGPHVRREPLEGLRSPRGPRKTCCRRAWLRGAFLAGGSLTRPEHGYHLEFVLPPEAVPALLAALDREGIRAGRDGRRVYVKAAEDIVAFLSVVGAVAERLAYDQVLVGRDLKNRVQREVNCETANLSRTVQAAQRQVALIQALGASGRLAALPAEVQETARLRKLHPFATLADLASLHDPPVSKSAVNHRLRALLSAP